MNEAECMWSVLTDLAPAVKATMEEAQIVGEFTPHKDVEMPEGIEYAILVDKDGFVRIAGPVGVKKD